MTFYLCTDVIYCGYSWDLNIHLHPNQTIHIIQDIFNNISIKSHLNIVTTQEYIICIIILRIIKCAS